MQESAQQDEPMLELTDGVLTLRPLDPSDLDTHLDALDEEQIAWLWEPGDRERYLARTGAEQRAGHLRYLESCRASFGPGPKWVFAGDVGEQPYVVYVDCDLACRHVPDGQANISYTTHKDHRGQGYASRAVRLACAFLRDHTEAIEAHCVVDADNAASIRVAVAAGGVLRESFTNDHGRPTQRYVIGLRPASRVRLRPLSLKDEQDFRAAQRAMEPEGFQFGFDYDEGMAWPSYLALVDAQAAGRELPGDRVRASLLVGDVGGEIVGRISIRHDLNEWLSEVGGHIGYCVLPGHRRLGYATEMLRQSLLVARDLGIPNVLLTCDEDNVGSREVIEACGGSFERHAINPDGPLKRRYWIPTAAE